MNMLRYKIELMVNDAVAAAGRFSSALRGGMASATSRVGGLLGGIGSRIKEAFGGAAGLIGGAVGVTFSLAGAIGLLGQSLRKSFELERYKTQFAVLLGSVDAAKQRMADLVKFAASTPFELPEIAKASKTLEVMTRGVLSGAEGLRLVGDAAAVTGQPFSEVAMWVGRAYDAIKSGRPFGEAAMRLQEMGILSGTARGKIEELQASGASAADVWAVLRGEMEKSSGGMQQLSQTGEGLMSTLNDTISGALASLGDKFQDLAKDKIKTLIDWIAYLQETKFDAWAQGALDAFSKIGKGLGWVAEKFMQAQDFFKGAGGAVGTLIGGGSLDDAVKAYEEDSSARKRKDAEDRKRYDERKQRQAQEQSPASTDAADAQKEKERKDLDGAPVATGEDEKVVAARERNEKRVSDRAYEKMSDSEKAGWLAKEMAAAKKALASEKDPLKREEIKSRMLDLAERGDQVAKSQQDKRVSLADQAAQAKEGLAKMGLASTVQGDMGISQRFDWKSAVGQGRSPDEQIAANTEEMKKYLQAIAEAEGVK